MSVAKATSAGLWSAADIVLRQLVGFIASVILARLLAPEDFGLIALLGFFTSLSIVFVQGGLTLALVQRQETTAEQENAVFWSNLCAGILFALILIAIAPVVARFYGYPLMNPLMYVAAAQVVLSSLGAVQTALLTRNLQFQTLTKTGIVSSLASGAAAVAAAFAGWGVWALAVQILVQSAVASAALWWVSAWRPRWTVRFSSIHDLARFGVNISLSSILEVLYSNGIVLLIGKFYGARDLGFLARATSIQGLPTGIISQIIARTALPLFAARADDKDALLRGFRMAVRLSMLLSLPLMAGLAMLSHLVIFVLLGEKWLPAAPVLTVVALSGTLLPLQVLNLQLLLARGDSKAFLRLEIRKKIAGIACYGIGCFYGIMGVAYASVAFSILAYLINVRPTKADFDYGAIEQLKDILGIILVTMLMSASVLFLNEFVGLSPMPKLVILTLAGGTVYIMAGLMLRLRAFQDTLQLALSVIRPKAAHLSRT